MEHPLSDANFFHKIATICCYKTKMLGVSLEPETTTGQSSQMITAATLLVALTTCGICQEILPQKEHELRANIPVTVKPAHRKTEDWWSKRHDAKLAKKKDMGEVDLLMVGDSITHSWETTCRSTWDKFYSNRKALNIGFSGDRTEHVIWRLKHGEMDGIKPKLAVIMIGTNNTGHRMDAASDTAAGIRSIIKEIQDRSPRTKILLLGVFPRGHKADAEDRVRNAEINELIGKYADEKKVWYLDLAQKFLDSNGTLPKDIMPDSLHPNAKGYEIWAEAMEPKINELLK